MLHCVGISCNIPRFRTSPPDTCTTNQLTVYSKQELHFEGNQKRYAFLGKFVLGSPDDKYFERKLPQNKFQTKLKVNSLSKLQTGKQVLRPEFVKPVDPVDEIERRENPRYFEDLVERRIREAIAQGEFENLPYTGQPLPGIYDTSSSIADPTDEMCYKLLKRNGFRPDWVELNITIRRNIQDARSRLIKTYITILCHEQEELRLLQNPPPQRHPVFELIFGILLAKLRVFRKKNQEARKILNFYERETLWNDGVREFQNAIEQINKKVLTYNLMVPMYIQMFSFDANEEIEKMKKDYDSKLWTDSNTVS